MTQPDLPVVGIDVSKAKLDVFIDSPSRHLSVANSDDGIAKLVEELLALKVRLVVVEATGRYHRRIAASLFQSGIPVTVANPQQTRQHAGATGHLEKTDKIDAKLLADFGRRLDPRTIKNPSEISTVLGDLVARRRGLVQIRVAEKNRAHDDLPKFARTQSNQLLRLIEQQIEELDREIAKQIEADDDWHNKSRIIDSVPGIGPDSANQIVVELPELGKLNRQQIAKLAGVAPLNRDSGTQRGQRSIRGGRSDTRSTLYMCAHNAVMYSNRFRTYFQSLIARGKKHKVAMVACMRKLLVTLNQMVKTNTYWNEKLNEELT